MMWLPRVTAADLENDAAFAGWTEGLERQLQILNGSGPRYRVRLVTPDAEAEADEDENAAEMALVVEREHHGTQLERVIHEGFFQSPEYELIAATGAEFNALIESGAYVTRGKQRFEISRFPDAIEWLMDQAKQSQSIQRYKGLGEMNPQQLWDTTVNPETRRLTQVRIDDAVAADEIFSTLMGDHVEPRRDFIERNALAVANLDI